MRPKEIELAKRLDASLIAYSKNARPLPGISAQKTRNCLVEQLVESMRRIRFVSVIAGRPINAMRADPSSDLFDPLRAAILHQRSGNVDESFWQIFLFVHFGKSARTGWQMARDVYGRLDRRPIWDWNQASSNPRLFRKWIAQHEQQLRGADGVRRQFGNHRKFETLKESSERGTGRVVESYVDWVMRNGGHRALIQSALQRNNRDPRTTFAFLFDSMSSVISFGRTAKFDYLTMLGKLGLAPIEAPSAYMQDATGPLKGARLLFCGDKHADLGWKELDAWLIDLEAKLRPGSQGMQVMEDALCNWQKSPATFEHFRG